MPGRPGRETRTGWTLEETIRWLGIRGEEIFFWGTHQGAELDLLVFLKGKRIGFEFKYTDAPQVTRSMKIALQDLKLSQIKIVFPGKEIFPLDGQIQAVGLEALTKLKFD